MDHDIRSGREPIDVVHLPEQRLAVIVRPRRFGETAGKEHDLFAAPEGRDRLDQLLEVDEKCKPVLPILRRGRFGHKRVLRRKLPVGVSTSSAARRGDQTPAAHGIGDH